VRELAGNYLQIAHTGIYDSARYGSPSQARQAVITAAVWAGMSMVDVLARISDGRWRGLASFYARYSNSTSRREALSKFDWPAAVAYVTAEGQEPRVEPCPPIPHKRASITPGGSRAGKIKQEHSR